MSEEVKITFSGEDKLTHASNQAAAGLGKLSESAKKAGMVFTELKSGIDLAGQALQKMKQGYDFAKQGAQLEFTAMKFDRLATSIGTTGDALTNKLQKATQGTLSQMDSMAMAADLLGLGLTRTEDDTVRLAAVVSGLGMDMNQLVLTLANQTTMRFDQLGVAVVGFDEKVKALKESGMDANAAFTEAFLQQAEEQLVKVGNAADTNLGKFMKFEAAAEDVTNSLKVMAGAAVADDIGQFAWQIKHATDILDEMGRVYDQAGHKLGGFAGIIQFASGQAIAEQNVAMREANAETQKWTERLDYLKQSAEGVAPVLEMTEEQTRAISEANQQFLGVMGQVGERTETYKNGIAEADAALAEGKISVEEHSAKIRQLGEDYAAAGKQIVMSIIEANFARDTWTTNEFNAYLAVGQQFGVFTQEQVDQTKALMQTADQVSKSYLEMDDPLKHVTGRSEDAADAMGNLTETQAALGQGIRQDASPAVAGLAQEIAGLSDKQVNVDVNIRVHGRMPSLGGGNAGGDMGWVAPDETGAKDLELATGGTMGAGWTLVGEKGYELISPTGHVYTHGQSRGILSGGLTPQYGRMFGGELGPGVVTPGVMPGKWVKPPRKKKGGSSAPISSGSGGGGSEETEEVAAVTAGTTASMVTPVLQAQASATQAAMIQQTAALNLQIAEQKKTNALLVQLIGATPNGRQELFNQLYAQSLGS